MKRVLISGGSRGIGAALVRAFTQNGYRVAFLYRSSHETAKALADETGAAAVCCDIADPDAVNESYKAAISHQNILMPNALEVLSALKARGYRLFIITNGDAAIQHKRLATSPITPLIEKTFISEEIGYAKPAKAFFDAVECAIEGFDKTKALVIGDSESSDMLGAQNAGIDACFFSPKNAALPDGISAKYRIRALRELLVLL